MTNTEQRSNATREEKREPLFIGGWLTDEFAAGRRPVYGYPSSSLPEVTGEPMEVVTGFLAGR